MTSYNPFSGNAPAYAMPSRFPSGARCRVCSTIYGPDVLGDVQFCPEHAPDNDSEEARLGRVAVRLQQFFGYGCEEYRAIRNWVPAWRHWSPRSLSDSERQWWKWVVQFHLMCEYSHRDLAAFLRYWKEELLFTEYEIPVVAIFKLRFITLPQYGPFRHCAFVIALPSGFYVFDPTDVQFGPDWPLISPFGEYRNVRMHPNDAIAQITIDPLDA